MEVADVKTKVEAAERKIDEILRNLRTELPNNVRVSVDIEEDIIRIGQRYSRQKVVIEVII